MWLVLSNNILTKDNLVRIGWTGSKACPFYGMDESIDHLFMQYSISIMAWNILKCAFNFMDVVVDNIHDLFNIWTNFFGKAEKHPTMVGVLAVFWKTGKLINSFVFDNNKINHPCVLVNMIARWLND